VAELEDHLADQADIVLQLNEGPSQGTRSGHVNAAKFKALQAQVEEVTKQVGVLKGASHKASREGTSTGENVGDLENRLHTL
jgi:hypothetical protein